MVARGDKEATEGTGDASCTNMEVRSEEHMKRSARYSKKAFSYRAVQDVPHGAIGIYAFWCRQNGKCVYVGKAADQSIRDRLRQHVRQSHNRTLWLWLQAFGRDLDMCYAAVDRPRIDALEKRLIGRWRPEANVHHKK